MDNFTSITGAADLRDEATDASAFDTDVFVVGAGPMGATTSLALATYGVRVMMISQWSWLANTPRAHITKQRAVEVLRDLGVEEIRRSLGSDGRHPIHHLIDRPGDRTFAYLGYR